MTLFFFSSRRRHTRCSRDWSSDVCSSDPIGLPRIMRYKRLRQCNRCMFEYNRSSHLFWRAYLSNTIHIVRVQKVLSVFEAMEEIGRASCRGKSVDLGGRRIIKKKKKYICR